MSPQRSILIIVPAAAAFVAVAALAAHRARSTPDRPDPPEPPLKVAPQPANQLIETPPEWIDTSEGDFEERAVDWVDGRLRLSAATRGTRADTVKCLGVRSGKSHYLGKGATVFADLDWNNQANGSFLTAGLVLAPVGTTENPCATADWLRVEYIGVPPGRNARLAIVVRTNGQDRPLFAEGWPDRNREGRAIGLQRLKIAIEPSGAFSVFENDQKIFQSEEGALPFETAYLYLQMTSRTNYPPREVFFGNARFDQRPK